MGHPQEFVTKAALEDLGLFQWGLGMEEVQQLESQWPWQNQVHRGSCSQGSRRYDAIRVFLASNRSVPLGIKQAGGTAAWITESLAMPHRQGSQQPLAWEIWCSVQFSHSVLSSSLWLHGLQHMPGLPVHHQLLEFTNSCPLSLWCHSTISSSVVPFSSCLQSFPASGSFLMSRCFAPSGQSIGLQPQHQSLQWIFRVDFL